MNIKKIIIIILVFLSKNISGMKDENNNLKIKIERSNANENCQFLITKEENENNTNNQEQNQQNSIENHQQEENINYIQIQNEINNQVNSQNNINQQAIFLIMKNCFILSFITGMIYIATFFTLINKTINK